MIAAVPALVAYVREMFERIGSTSTELLALLGNPTHAKRRIGKRRCELALIDFVEMFWPIVEPEQPFVRGWVQEAICAHLQAVSESKITKLLINVPPGFTKSMLVNVFWPAWEWGPQNRPDLRYISWSYSPSLTSRDNENCRKIMESDLYQEWWGDRFKFDENTNAKAFYKNDHGGFRIATSINGTGTGLRADRLIWDDPHSVSDGDSENELTKATRWFSRTLPTRVRNAGNEISKVKVPFWVREIHGQADKEEHARDATGEIDEAADKFISILKKSKDGKRKAVQSATVGIMQRIHLHDISGIIIKNPELGYEHMMVEMEWKGATHPGRSYPGRRVSSIGYKDPREDLNAVIDTIADLDLCALAKKDPTTREESLANLAISFNEIARDIAKLADPIRFPRHEVETLKHNLMIAGGSDAVQSQLDQWPIPQTGDWFENAASKIIEPHECPQGLTTDERGFDLASGSSKKSAQTASVKLRTGFDKRIYIQHSSAMRGGPAKVDTWFKLMHSIDAPDVEWSIPEDPGSGGKHVAAYHKRENAPGRYVRSTPERGSKVERAKPISAQFNGDNVRIVRHDGCEQLVKELTDFPYGEFCDLVDALSRAYDAQLMKPLTSTPYGGEMFDASGELFTS